MFHQIASLKSEIDKLHIDELETVSVDLKKLSDMVDKTVVKKSDYNTDKHGLDKNNRRC